MIQTVLRNKTLNEWRLLDKWYLIGIDGTGTVGFKHRHCPKCLKRKLKDGSTYYYHPVLEAKLVTGNGLALSIGTEYMENTEGWEDEQKKQDCELKAFYRLAKRLKKEYPQLSICLLMDGLYAKRTVYDICKKNGWKYIITFKEGCSSDLYKWYITMRDKLYQKNYKEVIIKDGLQKFRWISPFEHFTGEIFHVFECEEEVNREVTHFVWSTNIEVTEANVTKLANQGGRLRWKVENEGFNTQKNGGYGLEHVYSRNPNAIKNFYMLIQITHLIDQLFCKGSLISKEEWKEIEVVKHLFFLVLEQMRNNILQESVLKERFQNRLNSG